MWFDMKPLVFFGFWCVDILNFLENISVMVKKAIEDNIRAIIHEYGIVREYGL